MDERTRERFARKFGLPPGQIRLFDKLTSDEKEEVGQVFSLYRARAYVYAIKQAGGLVWGRYRL